MLLDGTVGPQYNVDGIVTPVRMGKLGCQIVTQLHGRYYEQCYRGALFSYGASNFSTTSTHSTGTTGATNTPIIGVWNPYVSPVNLIILQVTLVMTTVINSATFQNGWFYMQSQGNRAITTGLTPYSAKTLTQGASFAKAYANGPALTGMTSTLSVLRGAPFFTLNATGAATATSIVTPVTVDNIDGSVVVPPGGVFTLAPAATNGISVSASIVWEEMPIQA